MKSSVCKKQFVWLRIGGMGGTCLLTAGCATAVSVYVCVVGPRELGPARSKLPVHRLQYSERLSCGDTTLKVLTLNAAHGRSNGKHQLLQSEDDIKSNLRSVAAVLNREQPHLVALQEADGPSFWSGDFDHVKYLASKSSYPYSIRANHVNREKMAYGTGLLSALPLEEPVSVTFAPTPPTSSKGLVVTTIAWPGEPDFLVDVVSVHLDFSRGSVRRQQVDEIVKAIGDRDRPLIVMGDFNCQWQARNSALRDLAERLDLKAYTPWAGEMNTFPKLRRRLDWILISRDLEYSTYRVLPDIVSDHRGVVATLRIAGSVSQDSPGQGAATDSMGR